MRAKKLTALALTLALAASLGLPALAAPSVSSSQVTKTLTNNSATTDTQITGTIVATQLKVTLPLTISFDIDPVSYTHLDVYKRQARPPSGTAITGGPLAKAAAPTMPAAFWAPMGERQSLRTVTPRQM